MWQIVLEQQILKYCQERKLWKEVIWLFNYYYGHSTLFGLVCEMPNVLEVGVFVSGERLGKTLMLLGPLAGTSVVGEDMTVSTFTKWSDCIDGQLNNGRSGAEFCG
jgi:hypothetical protein